MINQIKMLCSNLICICTDTTIYLFRTPDVSTFCCSTDPPELILHWNMDTHHLGAADLRLYLGPLTSTLLEESQIPFSVGDKIYISSFSWDASACSLQLVSSATKTWSNYRDVSSFHGRCCVWAPSISTGVPNSNDSFVVIQLCFFLGLGKTANRLHNSSTKTVHEVERVAIHVPCPFGMNVWNIEYDEWSGTILIHWWGHRGEDGIDERGGSKITVIQLATLARKARAMTPH